MKQVEQIIEALLATPGWLEVAESIDLDTETLRAVLNEAERFAIDKLRPLGRKADVTGCRIDDGHVSTPVGYNDTYIEMGNAGWLAVDIPEQLGGQGLLGVVHAATSVFFEAEATAFMMMNGSSRPAAHLISALAPKLAQEWVPRLASGEWAATICISEPDAGSDVGRIRTRATKQDDTWYINGTKCWISFGDQDITQRIGHCMLARTGSSEEGTRGLSLFLVPDKLNNQTSNGVSVSRIEEKLGLHGSPTCVMAFENSQAILLGDEGFGIQNMFSMIEKMRLQTACQGLGISQKATALANVYARERRQGGKPDKPPISLLEHADVRLQLTTMAAHTMVLRGMVFELAVQLELANIGNKEARCLAAFFLPLAKNFGGETAFNVASDAIQILGGAGYTQEWPAEQLLRDARVITIYEGTTGMQAQDFLHRGLLKNCGNSLSSFFKYARPEIANCSDEEASSLALSLLDRFSVLSNSLLNTEVGYSEPDLAAVGYLNAGWVMVSAWLCCRFIGVGSETERLARFRLHCLSAEMAAAEAGCKISNNLIQIDDR